MQQVESANMPPEQPTELALRNITAKEKMALTQEMLSWMPFDQLIDDSFENDKAECKVIGEALYQGTATFVDPVALGASAEPEALSFITKSCPNISFYEEERRDARERATRNFTLYSFDSSTVAGGLALVFGERWCRDGEDPAGPCVALPVATIMEPKTCRVVAQFPIGERQGVYPYEGAAIAQGVLRVGDEFYFAEVGGSCQLNDAKQGARFAIEIRSIAPRSKSMHCIFSSQPVGGCKSTRAR